MSDPVASVKYMFDSVPPGYGPGIATTTILDPGPGAGPGEPVPLERREAQICELAGHLAAATCRFLVQVGEFDARRGWATWEMNSDDRQPDHPGS